MQMYTITDNTLTFTFPDISTTGCPFVYTYSVVDAAAGSAITFTDTLQQFEVFWDTDLTLSGSDFTDYTVTVTATTTGFTPVEGTFVLRIK